MLRKTEMNVSRLMPIQDYEFSDSKFIYESPCCHDRITTKLYCHLYATLLVLCRNTNQICEKKVINSVPINIAPKIFVLDFIEMA